MAEDKQTLQQQLDAITFKNAQVHKIKALQEGRQRLSDSFGRNKKRYATNTADAATGIAGLQTLGNSFGK